MSNLLTRRRALLAAAAVGLALAVPIARSAIMSFTDTATYGSGTNTAGSTANGATVDARNLLKVTFAGSITNGATAPTIAGTATLQWSPDNFTTTWPMQIATGSLTNSATTNFYFEVWAPAGYVRLTIGTNTAQSVTYSISSATVTSMQ